MLMANGNSNLWSFEDVSAGAGDDDGLCIDIDSFWNLLEETPDPQQNGLEDSSSDVVPQGSSPSQVGVNDHSIGNGMMEMEAAPLLGLGSPGSVIFPPLYHSETSDTRTVGSDGSLESAGNSSVFGYSKLEPSLRIGSPMQCSSGSLANWVIPVPSHEISCVERYKVFGDVSSGQHDTKTQLETANCITPFNFPGGDNNVQLMEESGINHGTYCDSGEDSLKTSGTPDIDEASVMDFGEISDILCETGDGSSVQYLISTNEPFCYNPSRQHVFENFGLQSVSSSDEMIVNIKAEPGEHLKKNATLSEAHLRTQGGVVNRNSVVGGLYGNDKGSNRSHSLPCPLLNLSAEKQVGLVKDEEADATVTSVASTKVMGDVGNRRSSDVAERLYADRGSSQSCSSFLTSISMEDHVAVKAKTEDVWTSEQPFLQPVTSIRSHLICTKEERESKFVTSNATDSSPSKVSNQAVQSNFVGQRTYVDDDPDICILEDMSEPARKSQSLGDMKPLIAAQRPSLNAPLNHVGLGGVRLKTNDERFIFRVALQDLSQPKSEASPPDGVLAVPLLRHQRIALSWMVQKETASVNCSGGILADDQGLGKTISTIALILKERSPSTGSCATEMKQTEMETLNLDDDDETVIEHDVSKQKAVLCPVQADGDSTKHRNTSGLAKGRPAAGTLVVCPTSVLRQWFDELHNKVSDNARLTVLVYHGGNRTKDPAELAKYDVVLTTYSIVSMEVPKQPLVDEDDDETKKASHCPPVGLSSSRKRKYPPSSAKSSSKGKKGIDSELFESLARPLARVSWFRVVLDEAQSIKNHRTQVARACWGLRAKRRWCLSGTPIQNAIDDLYSYFRFLRYDPYAVYKSFCSSIKVPIQRSPSNGYRKLQAILKTIMLRRTKGTLLDGEPIINLPPKTVELKKVVFSDEERDFYCRLEADSRAQFAEYAAAGTVKQNYVNILLMLLRLRQACDHPLLVSGRGSNSEWRSSLEVAKKLPHEKQIRLLNCLEASLAICGLCTDPPEDAVVTICEHVFCKQCILEHLSGDDTQCPSTKCKSRLSISSVFSRVTLRSSLCDQSGQEGTHDLSSSISVEALEASSSTGSSDSSKIEADEALGSSKIKAALEVLLSLSKPRDYISRKGSLSSVGCSASTLENPLDDISGGFCKDSNGNEKPIAGEKAIVFSQWTRMLDLLEACLKNSSINYRRLDGTMSVVARDKAVKDFNNLPEVSVMIMSLKAASLGLNMVAACHVLLLDLWWNPTTEDQAVDRAHRIGQTRPVTVLRLTVKDTVEDRILALQQKKREMVSSAFGEDETGSRQTRLTVDDLKYLFNL